MEKAREGGGDNGRKLGWILNFSQVTDFIIFEKVNAGEGGKTTVAGHGPFSFVPLSSESRKRKYCSHQAFLSLSLPLHRLATFSRGIYSRE